MCTWVWKCYGTNELYSCHKGQLNTGGGKHGGSVTTRKPIYIKVGIRVIEITASGLIPKILQILPFKMLYMKTLTQALKETQGAILWKHRMGHDAWSQWPEKWHLCQCNETILPSWPQIHRQICHWSWHNATPKMFQCQCNYRNGNLWKGLRCGRDGSGKRRSWQSDAIIETPFWEQ